MCVVAFGRPDARGTERPNKLSNTVNNRFARHDARTSKGRERDESTTPPKAVGFILSFIHAWRGRAAQQLVCVKERERGAREGLSNQVSKSDGNDKPHTGTSSHNHGGRSTRNVTRDIGKRFGESATCDKLHVRRESKERRGIEQSVDFVLSFAFA